MFVVAGATGHVGSVVARLLLAAGRRVRVIARSAARAEPFAREGAEVAVGRVDDEGFLAGALRGTAGAFLLLPPNPAAADFYGWQRETGAGYGRAVKASGVPHVVLLSSVGADLSEGNGPIKGLFHAEHALRESGAKVTAIRAGYFQENLGGNVAAARAAGVFPNFMPSQDMPMPMIATRDIGLLAATSLALPPAKSEIVDLHGPAYTIKEQAAKIGAAVGKTLQIIDIPQAGWVPAMTQAGLPPQMAEAYAEMYAGFTTGQIVPKGDRFVHGTTTLDEVLPTLL